MVRLRCLFYAILESPAPLPASVRLPGESRAGGRCSCCCPCQKNYGLTSLPLHPRLCDKLWNKPLTSTDTLQHQLPSSFDGQTTTTPILGASTTTSPAPALELARLLPQTLGRRSTIPHSTIYLSRHGFFRSSARVKDREEEGCKGS